jgi:alpha-tubulin suppressor-like RCC1 family protein
VEDFDMIKQYFLNMHMVGSIGPEGAHNKYATSVHMLVHKQNISKVVFGSNFMVMLTERGEVFKMDEPEKGQPPNRLTGVSSSHFEGGKVVELAAGHSYILFLTSNKQIFSMGIGESGTLGHGKDVTVQLKPKRIEFYQKVAPEIISIEAGLSHAAALTRIGKVFIWGYGGDGRLGIGNSDPCFTPKLVDQLESETITNVSCG